MSIHYAPGPAFALVRPGLVVMVDGSVGTATVAALWAAISPSDAGRDLATVLDTVTGVLDPTWRALPSFAIAILDPSADAGSEAGGARTRRAAQVAVRGTFSATVIGADGTERVSGPQVTTWVDKHVEDVTELELSASPAGEADAPALSIVDGVVQVDRLRWSVQAAVGAPGGCDAREGDAPEVLGGLDVPGVKTADDPLVPPAALAPALVPALDAVRAPAPDAVAFSAPQHILVADDEPAGVESDELGSDQQLSLIQQAESEFARTLAGFPEESEKEVASDHEAPGGTGPTPTAVTAAPADPTALSEAATDETENEAKNEPDDGNLDGDLDEHTVVHRRDPGDSRAPDETLDATPVAGGAAGVAAGNEDDDFDDSTLLAAAVAQVRESTLPPPPPPAPVSASAPPSAPPSPPSTARSAMPAVPPPPASAPVHAAPVHVEPVAPTPTPTVEPEQGPVDNLRDPRGTQILARSCFFGHPNPPVRMTCAQCGGGLSPNAQLIERPSLGWVDVSTGERVDLSVPIVVGRFPQAQTTSAPVSQRLITVPSPSQDISRSHLEIRLEGWHVLLVDLDTVNGTTLLRAGQAPRRLHPLEPTLVAEGDVVDLGDGIQLAFQGLA